jgi:hypothetical protein
MICVSFIVVVDCYIDSFVTLVMGKFFGFHIDLFTVHTIMRNQAHRRCKPIKDYKQSAMMCNHTLKS